MDRRNIDLEGLSDQSMDGVDPSGYTVDEILAEARGEKPRPTSESAPERGYTPDTRSSMEPEYAPEPEYSPEARYEREPERAREPDYPPETRRGREPEYAPEHEYVREYAPEGGYDREDGFDGLEDDGEDYAPKKPRRSRRRYEEPEEAPEAEEWEDEPPRGLPFSVSNGFLGLLAAMVLSLLILGTAVVADLPDPAWSVLVIGALVIACVPLFVGGLGDMGSGRLPASFIMFAAVIIYGLSAHLVEAAIAAVMFNVCRYMVSAYCERELDIISDRLSRSEEPEDPRATLRRMACVRGVLSGRMRPMEDQRRIERLTLLGGLVLGLFVSLIPPLIDGMDFAKWVARGAVVLSLCAFYGEAAALIAYLNSVESSFAAGVCFAGADVMADAANASSVVFNKTGTLTDGNYTVRAVDPVRISEKQLLYLASYAGAYSGHPLMRAIRDYSGFEPDKSRILRHRVQPGYGSMVMMEGNQIVGVGNIDFMERLGIKGDLYVSGDTCVFVSVGRSCVGRIDFADSLSEGAQSVASALRRERVANVALMTGDNALSATNVGKSVNISEIYSDCRPQDKAARLRYIIDTQEREDRLIVVSRAGEDRELLEMANIGVTLGVGLDATDKFPDVIIPTGGLMKLPKLIRYARSASRSVTLTNTVYAGVRCLAAILAIVGVLPLWVAAIVMSGVQLGTFIASNSPAEK